MTDYNPFTTEELLPGAAGTSFHFQRWANNPIAMFEGQPNAPKMQRAALNAFGFGDTVFYENMAGGVNGTTNWAEVARFNFVQIGGLRVKFSHAPSGGGNIEARVVLYRAGGATVLSSWTTAAVAYRVLDIWVLHGDMITVEHRMTPGFTFASNIGSIQYTNDGTAIWDTIGGRVKF